MNSMMNNSYSVLASCCTYQDEEKDLATFVYYCSDGLIRTYRVLPHGSELIEEDHPWWMTEDGELLQPLGMSASLKQKVANIISNRLTEVKDAILKAKLECYFIAFNPESSFSLN